MLKKQKIILVDGYNVLRNESRYANVVGQAPNFQDWTTDVWNAAREALLNDVLKMLDKNSQAIIVYDAANRKSKNDEFELPLQQTKHVQIIFTNPGESADTRIQKLAHNFREKFMEVQVITNDLNIQNTTMHRQVVRRSSCEFVHTLENPSEDNKNITAKSGEIFKSKLEDIVDPQTAEKLRNLRNSL